VQNFFKTLPKLASYPAYQNSISRKNFTMPFLKYKRLKLKLRVFLTGHSVAMATYCVTKIIPTCSPVIGQSFDTMVVSSSGNNDTSKSTSWKVLETALSHLKRQLRENIMTERYIAIKNKTAKLFNEKWRFSSRHFAPPTSQ